MRKNKREKKARKPKNKTYKFRIYLLAFLFALAFVLDAAKLVQLTLFSDARVSEFSEKQRSRSVKLHLPRGMIYDRNQNELAVSIKLRSVYVNPKKISDPDSTAQKLALRIEPDSRKNRKKLYKKLKRSFNRSRDKYFVWVERKVSPEVYAKIKADKIPGVGFVRESKRFYPKRNIAAKVIGFAGIDNQGLSGLEYRYDNVIRPVSAQSVVRKDALGRPVSMPDALNMSDAASPYDLLLTIDERIQYIAEKALERQVLKSGAKGGVAIVMDPHNGEILTMAEQPTYNPNQYSQYRSLLRKSHIVSNSVEPGSTFKLFVAASALEEKVVKPDELIDCEQGRYRIRNKTFKEAHNMQYGMITLADVITKSSNIGAIKLAERLGPDMLRNYLVSFGFGSKTSIDLPAESSGVLRPVSDWSLYSLPSISFGQEVAVTPMQLAVGISVFANGGNLVRPSLVKAFMRNGKIIEHVEPQIVRNVISSKTAKMITEMMTNVVENGTGKKAAISGYSVAGKTGTAQKIDPATRRYSADKYLSSFAGFFPADNPRLVILVMIDEPEGIAWGGAVAGPVFAEIASRSARILRIPGDDTKIFQIDWAKMVEREEAAQSSNEDVADGQDPQKERFSNSVATRIKSMFAYLKQNI